MQGEFPPQGSRPSGISDETSEVLARLLKAWRAETKMKSGGKKKLSQAKVAADAGKTERWYRYLEAGYLPRPDREVMAKLAEALLLDPDQREMLFLSTIGCNAPAGAVACTDLSGSERKAIQAFLDQQDPKPAYVIDPDWTVVAVNRAMREWWPRVTEAEANVMHSILIGDDAREQLADWESHARTHLSMMRLEFARKRPDSILPDILKEAITDPLIERFWNEDSSVLGNRGGQQFRLKLTRFENEVTLTSQVFTLTNDDNLRLVVLSWPETDDGPEGFAIPTHLHL
ncbi:helix-turn-helix transcriptional regulator [Streptomyces sp. NPDC006798]|uniref:helix-turn-helix transcriptional regulator n=1 Tax=Streptomyces sp. NPDC006798 TaxID=3155462 RepID=UPI0033F48A7F